MNEMLEIDPSKLWPAVAAAIEDAKLKRETNPMHILHRRQAREQEILDRAGRWTNDGNRWAIWAMFTTGPQCVARGATFYTSPESDLAVQFSSQKGAKFAAREIFRGTDVRWKVVRIAK